MLRAISSPAARDRLPIERSATITITLSRDYDFSTKHILAAVLSTAEMAKTAIIDFAETNYIDCSCLGALVVLRKKMLFLTGRADVRFAGVNPHIAKIFTLCGFDTLFSMYATVPEALAARRSAI